MRGETKRTVEVENGTRSRGIGKALKPKKCDLKREYMRAPFVDEGKSPPPQYQPRRPLGLESDLGTRKTRLTGTKPFPDGQIHKRSLVQCEKSSKAESPRWQQIGGRQNQKESGVKKSLPWPTITRGW